MPATVTLADAVAEFRVRTETEGTQYPTDAQVKAWLRAGYRALYDKLIAAGGDFVPWSETLLTTVSGQDEYDVPTDFFRIKGVTVLYQQYMHRPLHPVQWGERTRYENAISWGYALGYGYMSLIGYALKPKTGATAAKLKFLPAPDGIYTVRLDYIPLPTVPTQDTDVIDTGDGWDEYAICWACVRMGGKEETNAGSWYQMMLDAEARILDGAATRDDTEPAVAVDVQGVGGFNVLRTWP